MLQTILSKKFIGWLLFILFFAVGCGGDEVASTVPALEGDPGTVASTSVQSDDSGSDSSDSDGSKASKLGKVLGCEPGEEPDLIKIEDRLADIKKHFEAVRKKYEQIGKDFKFDFGQGLGGADFLKRLREWKVGGLNAHDASATEVEANMLFGGIFNKFLCKAAKKD